MEVLKGKFDFIDEARKRRYGISSQREKTKMIGFLISEGANVFRWPKQVIERDTDPAIKVWRNKRGREERICL